MSLTLPKSLHLLQSVELWANTEGQNRPHNLPPETILSAHLHPALSSHQSQLNARLQTTQSQNALLHDEVVRQRDEIAQLLSRLETASADVGAANDVLGELADELASEARKGRVAIEAASAPASAT